MTTEKKVFRKLSPSEKLARDVAFDKLLDTPGLSLNDYYRGRWKGILRNLIVGLNPRNET